MKRSTSSRTEKKASLDKKRLSLLLSESKFKEIKAQLDPRREALNKEERRAYGLALFHTGDALGALVAWQPLLGMTDETLDAHMKTAATDLLSSQDWGKTALRQRPVGELVPVFLVVRRLLPDHPELPSLQNSVFEALWECQDVSSAESLLKLVQSDKSLTPAEKQVYTSKARWKWLIEQSRASRVGAQKLADLLFHGNGILTGAATDFISISPPLSTDDFKTALESVVVTFMDMLSPLLQGNTKDEMDASLFSQADAIVGAYDAMMRADLLGRLPMLPAPGFLTSLSEGERRSLFEFFFSLNSLSEDIRNLYSPGGSNAPALAAAGNEKDAALEMAVRAVAEGRSPYGDPWALRIVLRGLFLGVRGASAALHRLLPHLSAQAPMFNAVVLKEVKEHLRLLAGGHSIPSGRQSAFDLIVDDASFKALAEADTKRAAVAVLLETARKKFLSHEDFTVELVRAQGLTDDADLRLSIGNLMVQVKSAVTFLESVGSGNFEKSVSKTLKKKKAAADEVAPLVQPICDAFTLTFPWHSFWSLPTFRSEKGKKVFDFLESLARIRLTDKEQGDRLALLEPYLGCPCPRCALYFSEHGVPELREAWSFKEPVFPRVERLESLYTETSDRPRSILDLKSPFEALEVVPSSSKRDVMMRVMEKMRASPNRMAELRLAQSELYVPGRRAAHVFIRFWCSQRAYAATRSDERSPPHAMVRSRDGELLV